MLLILAIACATVPLFMWAAHARSEKKLNADLARVFEEQKSEIELLHTLSRLDIHVDREQLKLIKMKHMIKQHYVRMRWV